MLETAFIASILSAVLSGVILLFIERRVWPEKEKETQSQRVIYQESRIHSGHHRSIARTIDLPGWVPITLSLLFPPLAVYLEKGGHRSFWINIGLTLLWLWPGVFHALFIVLGSRTKSV